MVKKILFFDIFLVVLFFTLTLYVSDIFEFAFVCSCAVTYMHFFTIFLTKYFNKL